MCWICRVPGSSLDIASVDAILVICVVFVRFVGFVGFQGAVLIGYVISLECAAFVLSLAFCEFGRGWSYQVRLHCNLHFCHIRSGYEYRCNQSHVLKILLPWRLMISWICVEHWGHRVLVPLGSQKTQESIRRVKFRYWDIGFTTLVCFCRQWHSRYGILTFWNLDIGILDTPVQGPNGGINVGWSWCAPSLRGRWLTFLKMHLWSHWGRHQMFTMLFQPKFFTMGGEGVSAHLG